VVDEERRQIIPNQTDSNVDQVVQPSYLDGLVSREQNGDELALEQLISVEEDIVCIPCASRRNQTWPEIRKSQLQRLDIVSSDVLLLLGSYELATGTLHLVRSEVDQPKSSNRRDGKADSISPLCGNFGVGRIPGAMVEDQEQDNQDDLVEKLTPALHEESTGDFATTVETVFLGGYFARANRVFHAGSGSHGVLATNADSCRFKVSSLKWRWTRFGVP
jgi:hypothetical protein